MRIGYIGGRAGRVNERVFDGTWLGYLGKYVDLVEIPALLFFRLFRGSIRKWVAEYPAGLPDLIAGLSQLCRDFDIGILLTNLPFMTPFLLLARNAGRLDLSLVIIAHSIASPFWLKLWLAAAPFISSRDALLCPSESARQALLNISDLYQVARHIPHFIAVRSGRPADRAQKKTLDILSIGRIEDVKNIDVLIDCFAAIGARIGNAGLTVAGQYTGQSASRIREYRKRIEEKIGAGAMAADRIEFTGPVVGWRKNRCFAKADLLVNISTDPGETFGYNLLEAQSRAVPVVCTNWNGFREFVSHNYSGLLVSCGWEGEMPQVDKKQLVAHAVRILGERSLREAIIENAYRESRKLDFRKVVPRVVEVIDEKNRAPLGSGGPSSEIACRAIADLGHYYKLANLSSFDFLDKSPLSLAAGANEAESLGLWMPKVKGIIGHYAGKAGGAEMRSSCPS